MSFAVFYIDKAVCLSEADALMKPQHWLLSLSLCEILLLLVNLGCCYNNTFIFVSSFGLAIFYMLDIFFGIAMAWQLCLYGSDITGSFFIGGLFFLATFCIAYRNIILIDDFYEKRQRLQNLKLKLNEGSVPRLQKKNKGIVEDVYISLRL